MIWRRWRDGDDTPDAGAARAAGPRRDRERQDGEVRRRGRSGAGARGAGPSRGGARGGAGPAGTAPRVRGAWTTPAVVVRRPDGSIVSREELAASARPAAVRRGRPRPPRAPGAPGAVLITPTLSGEERRRRTATAATRGPQARRSAGTSTASSLQAPGTGKARAAGSGTTSGSGKAAGPGKPGSAGSGTSSGSGNAAGSGSAGSGKAAGSGTPGSAGSGRTSGSGKAAGAGSAGSGTSSGSGKAAGSGKAGRAGTTSGSGKVTGSRKAAGSGKAPARDGRRATRPAPVRPGPRAPGRLRRALAGLSFDRLLPDDEAARQRRAARLRKAGLAVTGTVLAVVVIYAVFPVRTALDLRSSTDRARERLEAFREENARLEQEARELREDERIEQEARELGLAFPGEEVYGVLPAPEAPAGTGSTSTTRPGG